MSETYSETIVVGTIRPLTPGTRLREGSDTYAAVRGSYGISDVVVIDHIRTCLVSTDRPSVHVGDQWARVVSINGVPMPMPSWMAIKYNGSPICSESWVEQGDDPIPPDPTDKYTMGVVPGIIDAIKITGPANAVFNVLYNDVVIAGNINVEVDRTEGVTTVNVDGEEFTKPTP